MKTKYFLASILFFLSVAVVAQPPSEQELKKKTEKIKALKVEYITTKLDLTPEEAEKFWPLYNELNDKLQDLAKVRRAKMRKAFDRELTDEEVNELIALNFDTDQKMLDLKRQYDKKFKAVLPVQKVGKLYRAEQQFKKEMLRKMKGGGPGHGKGMGGPGPR